MLPESKAESSEKEILDYYKQNYKTKICREIKFDDFLDDKEKKIYQKYLKFCCCINPICLMVFSIIIFIFVLTGFIFCISKNKGYKRYKEILEKNMQLVDKEYPDDLESFRILSFLKINISDNICDYTKYSFRLCKYYQYKQFCTKEKYDENKCNYMDRQINEGLLFTCDYENYKSGKCNHVQYYDYLKDKNEINEDTRINYNLYPKRVTINLTDFSLDRKIITIGNYDQPLYLSFLIFIFIFIVFLIFDSKNNKEELISSIKYYIIIIFYILYYIIIRLYIFLFLFIAFYGFIVSWVSPRHGYEEGILEPSISVEGKRVPLDKLWKKKRINAFIFCGISYVLCFMLLIISFYKRIIYNYLSFYFGGKNNNNEIIRNASIKIGNNCYKFKIKQNKEIYLNENRTNKKHYFKEIILDNNVYYLKCDNLGLKNQLCWNEFKYPKIDIVFFNTKKLLILFIFTASILISNIIFKFEYSEIYEYYIHLIDLGYRPKKYEVIKNNYYFAPLVFKIINISYIIYGIIIISLTCKLIFFGGFKNTFFTRVSLFISIIIVLFHLAVFVLVIIGEVLNVLNIMNLPKENNDGLEILELSNIFITLLFVKNNAAYILIFLFSFVSFIYSIKLASSLNKIKKESLILEGEKKISEDEFKYTSLDNKNWFLEAVNNNNLPKHLFYQKKENLNNIKINISNAAKSPNAIIYLEKSFEEILDQKQKEELYDYKYKFINTKRIISRIKYNIIIDSIMIVFLILALIFSFGNNKYYKAVKEYLGQIDKIYLTGFIKFWYYLGDYENSVLFSFITVAFLFLIFEIICLLCQRCSNQSQDGIRNNLLLLMNIIFYIIFKIYFFLILFLLLYSFLAFIISPFDELKTYNEKLKIPKDLSNDWDKKKFIFYIAMISELLAFILNYKLLKVKYCIIDYLNKNYEENDEEDINHENIGLNEVKTSIFINNSKYNVRIKLNEVLYLQQANNNEKEPIYRFKKILIENITNNFIFVRLGFNSITDQISIADWHYPNLNYIFMKLYKMINYIYYIIFFSLPLFKFYVKDEIEYHNVKNYNELSDELNKEKPIFSDIFNKYGSLETKINNIIISFYIIHIIILLIVIIKRIYFGGARKMINIIISLIFSIISFMLNLIILILDFIYILIIIFCIISLNKNKYYKASSNDKHGYMNNKFFIQIIINIIKFIFNIIILKICKELTSDINRLRKEMVKLNKLEDNIDENKPDFKPAEFKYVSLEGINFSIKEVRNDIFQRYLFYSFDNLSDTEKTQANINISDINGVNLEKNSKNSSKIKISRNEISEKDNDFNDLKSVSLKKLV